MRLSAVIALLLTSLAVPDDAFACGTCVLAAFDRVLPPAAWWFVWSLTWLVAMGAALSWSKTSMKPQPRLPLSLVLAAAAVLAMAIVGPALGFALAVLPATAFFRSLRGEPSTAKRRIRFVTLAAMVAAMGLGARGYLVHSTRTDGDFVVQWENTVPAHQVFEYLAANPGAHEAELRKIAMLGSGDLAAKAKKLLETR